MFLLFQMFEKREREKEKKQCVLSISSPSQTEKLRYNVEKRSLQTENLVILSKW